MGGKPRVRRTAQEAQTVILDAAEAHLRARGPDGLRLKELAAEIGVSHPAILHHFGSRTALVKAVFTRTTERLRQQITESLATEFDPSTGATLLEGVFRTLADRGNARMFAWLFLAQDDQIQDPYEYGSHLRDIAAAVHRIRTQRHAGNPPPFEDTLYTVVLSALALFGNSIAGEPLRHSAGLGTTPADDRRFILWMAGLLRRHLEP
jgi:AcrR family transcriptional regulator